MFKLAFISAATFFVAVINAAPTLPELPDYKHFKSEIYPGNGVRFVSPQLCDPNVTQYAGYLDMGRNHYHFWFFESKENPTEKPLTAYLIGGPGCSGQLGIWSENGPCSLKNNGTEIGYKETTWTHASNMLYIDQPPGTGFSYGNKPISNLEETAAVFYEALQLFYEAFPKYHKLPFHIFGESYGGASTPVFAKYIIDQNLKLKESPKEKNKVSVSKQVIPLKSIGIMSGILDPVIQAKYIGLKTCDLKYGYKIPPENCQEIKKGYGLCEEPLRICVETGNILACILSGKYCTDMGSGYLRTGIHKSDMTLNNTIGEIPSEDYEKIINRPDIQKSIGAYPKKFKSCSSDVSTIWGINGQIVRRTAPIFSSVIDHGIPAIVVSGDADFLGNWLGIQETLSRLKFNGSESYNQLKMRPWFVQHKQVGEIKGTDKLTYALVYDAGHIIADGQPENTFALFDNWVNRKEFLDK